MNVLAVSESLEHRGQHGDYHDANHPQNAAPPEPTPGAFDDDDRRQESSGGDARTGGGHNRPESDRCGNRDPVSPTVHRSVGVAEERETCAIKGQGTRPHWSLEAGDTTSIDDIKAVSGNQPYKGH